MAIYPIFYIILVIHLDRINIDKKRVYHQNWSNLNKVKDIIYKINLLISRNTKKTKKNF